MDVATAMKALETAGSEKTRATHARHGVTGPQFGVSYAALGKLAKEAGGDTELARALWGTGNHDARVLATMVADPLRLTAADLELWSKDLACKALADAFGQLAARAVGARDALLAFTKSPDEWIGRAGWIGVAAMAAVPGTFPEDELSGFISALEKGIHRAKNHVKDARLCLLISIGALSDELEAKALAVARRIGPIDVDHGDTACETPDPLTYIPKARAHLRAKQLKEGKALARPARTDSPARLADPKVAPTSATAPTAPTVTASPSPAKSPKAASVAKAAAAKAAVGRKGVVATKAVAASKGEKGPKAAAAPKAGVAPKAAARASRR